MKAAQTQDTVLAEMVRRLVEAFQPERIYLFGSKVRGEADSDSDYDLLVVVSSADEPGYRLAQQAQDALWGVWEAADVIVLTRAQFDRKAEVVGSLPAAVLAEGALLYAA
jgi:predicted nucleotidyltransferase